MLQALLLVRGLPKTVIFNLRYLPLRQALRLPVLVSHRVALLDFRGTVSLAGDPRFGSILLGFGSVGAFDYRRSRSVWQVDGDVRFEGPARLGNGFKLSVAGEVTFGSGFVMSAESQLVCQDSIVFGPGCLVSWEVLVIDTDFHEIAAAGEEPGPTTAPVTIGEGSWLGARSTILKGVELASETVVAAGAVVARSEPEPRTLLAGNPAQAVRRDVAWRH